jgi:hypothetical protein
LKFVKYIAPRLIALTGLLVLFNWVYTEIFWWDDLEEHADVLNNMRKVEMDAPVLYFGESSNFNTSEKDVDKRRISDFLDDALLNVQVDYVEKGALHAGIYASLAKQLAEDARVEMLVVTLNLRSFSADWRHSALENYLSKVDMMLQKRPALLNRLLLSLKHYENLSIEERSATIVELWNTEKIEGNLGYDNISDWDRAVGSVGILNEDGSRNEELTQLATSLIKQFGLTIDTSSNRRIAEFDRLVQICKQRNIQLVFHLMAENHEAMKKLVGEEMIQILYHNQKLLIDRYHRNGVKVVDNLFALEDERFTDSSFPTEHYDDVGRKIVAQNVADSLAKWYPDKFVVEAIK